MGARPLPAAEPPAPSAAPCAGRPSPASRSWRRRSSRASPRPPSALPFPDPQSLRAHRQRAGPAAGLARRHAARSSASSPIPSASTGRSGGSWASRSRPAARVALGERLRRRRVVPAFGAGRAPADGARPDRPDPAGVALRWRAPSGRHRRGAGGDPERHDLYIDREGAGAVVRDRSGTLVRGRPPSFVLEQWLKADGDAGSRRDASRGGRAMRPLGCAVEAAGGRQSPW